MICSYSNKKPQRHKNNVLVDCELQFESLSFVLVERNNNLRSQVLEKNKQSPLVDIFVLDNIHKRTSLQDNNRM